MTSPTEPTPPPSSPAEGIPRNPADGGPTPVPVMRVGYVPRTPWLVRLWHWLTRWWA